MNTYVIESFRGSRIPFRVKADTAEEALEQVFNHMGMTSYRVVRVEDPSRTSSTSSD